MKGSRAMPPSLKRSPASKTNTPAAIRKPRFLSLAAPSLSEKPKKTQHENPAGQGQEDIVSEVDALLLKEKRQDTVSCLHQGCPKEEPHIVSQTVVSVEKAFNCHEGKCYSDTAG